MLTCSLQSGMSTVMIKKLLLLGMGLLLTGTLILAAWYRVDGIPVAATESFLSGDNYIVTHAADGAFLFQPTSPNGHGIIIMHGALIMPQSYAKSAAFFAQLGYTVYLPNGPGRMSIAAIDTVADWINQSGIDDWFFIGHSMGGMASLETIRTHKIASKAVALWATAMPRDFSEMNIPILFIWGDTDGLLPVTRFELGRQNLPAETKYITLEGANHKNFAMYSHQFFDTEATIDWMEQIDFANERTAAFFAQFL